MKNRILAVLLAVIIGFGTVLSSVPSAHAMSGLVTEKPVYNSSSNKFTVDSGRLITYVLNLALDYISDKISDYQRKIEIARYAYFYHIISNSSEYSVSMLNDERFNEDYLYQYFREYSLNSLGTLYDCNTFMLAAGYGEIWCYDMLAFSATESGKLKIHEFCKLNEHYNDDVLKLKTGFGYCNYEHYRDYYNGLLAQLIIKYKIENITITDEIEERSKQDITTVAPPVVSIEDFQEELISQNIVLGGKGMKNYSFREFLKTRDDSLSSSIGNSSNYVSLFSEGLSEVGATVEQGVYVLRYVYKDGKYYYSPYQYKLYITSEINSQVPDSFSAHFYTLHWDYLAVDALSGISPDSGGMEVYTESVRDDVSLSDNVFCNIDFGYSVYAEGVYWWGADRATIYNSNNGGPLFPYNTSYIYFNNKPEGWSNQFFQNNYKMFCENDSSDTVGMQDLSNHLNGFNACQPVYNFENHDSQCSYDCDLGFYVSSEPIDITTKLAPSRLPTTNTTITVKGDSVYDYSITDNSTGDTTTIYTYITNNYNYPPKEETSEPETSDTDTSEPSNITTSTDTSTTASGGGINIDINNKVEVNINGGNNSNYSMPDMSTVDDYLESALDDSSGFRKFMEEFFSFLPTPIITLLGILISAAIIARLMGR